MVIMLYFALFAANIVPAPAEEISLDQNFSSSQSRIERAIKKFNSEDYKAFLDKLDKSYQKERSSWQYDKFLEQRKAISRLPKEAFKTNNEALAKSEEKLVKKRNAELVDACLSMPGYHESASIRHMVFFTPSQSEQDALDYLYSLKNKFNGDGISPLENTLINLDMEYWLKSLSLETEGLKARLDLESLKERHLALDLEKLEKMKDAALSDPNSKEAAYILDAYAIYPKHKAVLIEEEHLYRLAKGHANVQNPLEEKAKQIMTAYLSSKDKLTRDHFKGLSHS